MNGLLFFCVSKRKGGKLLANELKHYGVLGMKWGVRKYQNKDGSLTTAGRKRYGEGGAPRYTSWSTKRRLKKATTKTDRVRAEASQKFDDAYRNYAKKTSVGKAIAGSLLMGPAGYKTYAMARTAGISRGKAVAKSYLDIGLFAFGVSVQRHNIRERYIDRETGTKKKKNQYIANLERAAKAPKEVHEIRKRQGH